MRQEQVKIISRQKMKVVPPSGKRGNFNETLLAQIIMVGRSKASQKEAYSEQEKSKMCNYK